MTQETRTKSGKHNRCYDAFYLIKLGKPLILAFCFR